jgi:hypothetical protein
MTKNKPNNCQNKTKAISNKMAKIKTIKMRSNKKWMSKSKTMLMKKICNSMNKDLKNCRTKRSKYKTTKNHNLNLKEKIINKSRKNRQKIKRNIKELMEDKIINFRIIILSINKNLWMKKRI